MERDIRLLNLTKDKHTVFTLVIGEFLAAYEGNYEVQLSNSNGKAVSKCYCRAVAPGTLNKDGDMPPVTTQQQQPQHQQQAYQPPANNQQPSYLGQPAYGRKPTNAPPPQRRQPQQYQQGQPQQNYPAVAQFNNMQKPSWSARNSSVMQAVNDNGQPEVRNMPRMGSTQKHLQQFIQ